MTSSRTSVSPRPFNSSRTRNGKMNMLNRFAVVAACSLIPVASAPLAAATPPPRIPAHRRTTVSSPRLRPGVVTSPDGWTLTVVAKDETQLPVAPLTTAVSSREYLVGGTFTGTVTGSGKTSLNGGTLEAGYQIGCGIEMGQVRLIGQAGIGLRRRDADRSRFRPASASRCRAPSRSTRSRARYPPSPWTRSRSRPRRRASP